MNKDFILGLFCLLFGVAVGYFDTEKVIVEEKIVQVNDAPVVKITTAQGIEDLRPGIDAVNVVLVFDKEIPNGYGFTPPEVLKK